MKHNIMDIKLLSPFIPKIISTSKALVEKIIVMTIQTNFIVPLNQAKKTNQVYFLIKMLKVQNILQKNIRIKMLKIQFHGLITFMGICILSILLNKNNSLRLRK